MPNTQTVKAPIIGNGTVVPVSVNMLSNYSIETVVDIKVRVSWSAGITLTSAEVDKGTFNVATNEWRVASLNPEESLTGVFSFVVTAQEEEPFLATFTYLNPPLSDTDADDNVLEVTIEGITCADVVGVCLDGSTTDTMGYTDPADGTVTHESFAGVSFTFPAGSQFVQSNLLSTVTPGDTPKVVYNSSDDIIGAVLIDGTQIAIPSGQANPVLTDNGNGTLTWDDQNGTTVTFQQGWTTVTHNGDGTMTFAYPSGSNQVIAETVTAVVDNGDGTFTFTDEEGVDTVVDTKQAAADGIQTATDNSTDLTVYVRYFGTTAPTVIKIGTGNYRISIPSGTKVLSVMVVGNDTNVSSNQLDLKILDNNGDEVYMIYEVISETSDTLIDKYGSGHLCTYTVSATNEINHAIPGLNYGATGFRILMTPVIKPT